MHMITIKSVHTYHIDSWMAFVEDKHEAVGHIFLEHQTDQSIKFMDAWVHQDYRRQGIYTSLWDTRWTYVVSNYPGRKVFAWCKPASQPLYRKKGFHEGESCIYFSSVVPEKEVLL